MKILFINPPNIQKKGLFPSIVFEPLGLAYLAAVLQKEGYNVSILDALTSAWSKITSLNDSEQLIGLTYKEIGDYVKNFSPQAVAIGVPFTLQAKSAFLTASAVKKIDKKIITILGGPHVTAYPKACLQNQDIDFIIMGEGEVPIVNLLKAAHNFSFEKLKNIRGIGFKKGNTLTINEREEPIFNLDSLPFPARHLLPMEEYFKAERALKTGRRFKFFPKKSASIITSRGCPFQCVFCSTYILMGRKWRFRSPKNVVDEIEELVKKYKVNLIHFEDDNATLDKKRMLEICSLILRRKLKIEWDTPNGVRADTLDKELLLKMKESGCKEICVAPESGNQQVVDKLMKKRINLKKVEEAVRICRQIGIKVEAFFVIGIVGETKPNIEETIKFAKKLRKLGATRCHFHIATPFEGTELYKNAKEMGYLVAPGKNCLQLETLRIQTPEFTCQDIDLFFEKGMKLNPLIPIDKFYLALNLLMSDPVRFLKTAFNYLIKRQGNLSS